MIYLGLAEVDTSIKTLPLVFFGLLEFLLVLFQLALNTEKRMVRQTWQRSWLLVALVVSSTHFGDTAWAATITFEGESSLTNYGLSGKVFSGYCAYFRMSISETEWNLLYADANGPTREEVTFDGSKTYMVGRNLRVRTNGINVQDLLNNGGFQSNKEVFAASDLGSVSVGRQPPIFVLGQMPWFAAWASGLIIEDPQKVIPPHLNLGSPERAATTIRMPRRITCETETTIEWILDPDIWKDVQLAYPQLVSTRFTITNKFTEAQLTILESVQLGNACVPLRAKFERYFAASMNPAVPLRTVISLKTTNFFNDVRPIELPAMTRLTHISDGRFTTSLPSGLTLRYSLSNAPWIAETNQALLAVAEKQKEALRSALANRRSWSNRNRRSGVVALLALFLLLPVLLFFIKPRLKHKTTITETQ